MRPPNPILVFNAGVRNTVDFAILWHLALCGLTGAGVQDIVQAVRTNENTVRCSLNRLFELRLATNMMKADAIGHPLVWVCSRLGYRLMTGHLKQEEKAAAVGQLPLGSEIIHQS